MRWCLLILLIIHIYSCHNTRYQNNLDLEPFKSKPIHLNIHRSDWNQKWFDSLISSIKEMNSYLYPVYKKEAFVLNEDGWPILPQRFDIYNYCVDYYWDKPYFLNHMVFGYLDYIIKTEKILDDYRKMIFGKTVICEKKIDNLLSIQHDKFIDRERSTLIKKVLNHELGRFIWGDFTNQNGGLMHNFPTSSKPTNYEINILRSFPR